MRYRLRTLLILLAIGPPLVAVGYLEWDAYRARQLRRAELMRLLRESQQVQISMPFIRDDSAEPNP